MSQFPRQFEILTETSQWILKRPKASVATELCTNPVIYGLIADILTTRPHGLRRRG